MVLMAPQDVALCSWDSPERIRAHSAAQAAAVRIDRRYENVKLSTVMAWPVCYGGVLGVCVRLVASTGCCTARTRAQTELISTQAEQIAESDNLVLFRSTGIPSLCR
jgi:hypothetical protein